MREGWINKRFDEVFDLQMGKTPDRKKLEYFGGNNVWVSIRDLGEKEINESHEHITDVAVTDTNIKIVLKGTVIMSFKLTVGKCGIASRDLYTNEAIMAFNVKKGFDLDSSFLYYYLQGYQWEGANKAVMGITLNKATISKHTISIPPLSIQQSIVAELDEINNLLSLKRKELETYDKLAQSLFYEMFGDPVENEKGWEVKKLGEITSTTSGGTPTSNHCEYYDGGTIPWLRSGEVSQGMITKTEMFITEAGLANSSAKYVPVDSVAIAMYGATVGQVGIIKKQMTTNQAICSIFPSDFLVPIYLMFFLRNMKPHYLKLAIGGAQPNISQSIIKATKIPLPPLPLQQLFATRIESIEEQKANVKTAIEKLETLLAARMQYWFD